MDKTTQNNCKTEKASEAFVNGLSEMLLPLRRFALALCRDGQNADDLTQSTCERALDRWTQYEPATRMDSWLFSIMHSIWKNQLRKTKNQHRAYLEVRQGAAHFDGENHVMGKIALSEVLSAIGMLNEDQRSAIVLVCVNGVPYRDAARILDIPQGTLESRIARGRIALGRLLDKQHDGRTDKTGSYQKIREYDEAN